MAIWIRSQDKKRLVNCNSFFYSDCLALEEGCFILSYENATNLVCLGNYSNKEKALKVLDMIQKELNEEFEMNLEVFQMPQDGEVHR